MFGKRKKAKLVTADKKSPEQEPEELEEPEESEEETEEKTEPKREVELTEEEVIRYLTNHEGRIKLLEQRLSVIESTIFRLKNLF